MHKINYNIRSSSKLGSVSTLHSKYEEAGVKEYWIVDPEREAVLVYVLSELGVFIGLQPVVKGKTLTSQTFPSLKVDLEEVFAE